MGWTAPRTWLAGERLTAALLNQHLRDNLLAAGTIIETGNWLSAAVTTLQTQAIVFATPFTFPPRVYAIARTSADAVLHVSVTGETTTGFNLHFKRSTAVGTNVAWVAVLAPAA